MHTKTEQAGALVAGYAWQIPRAAQAVILEAVTLPSVHLCRACVPCSAPKISHESRT